MQISWERAQSLLVGFGWEVDDFQVVRGSPKAKPSLAARSHMLEAKKNVARFSYSSQNMANNLMN